MSENAQIIAAQELAGKGIVGSTDLKMLRPVLAANADPYSANATLREDEWQKIDDRVNQVLRSRLTVADDLRSRGLVEPVSLGTVIRTTERLSDFTDAELSYDGDTAPDKDRANFEKDNIPIPVIAKDFSVNWRQLIASRERGDPLDTTQAEAAAAKVRLKIQSLITNGESSGGPTGGGIPGLTSASNRIEVTLSEDWDDSGKTGSEIIADVENMLDAAYAEYLFGPFVLYVPNNYWATVQGDHKAESDRTVMERILAFADIEAVRPNDALSDDNVVMVQMSRDVIDLSEAQAVTTVQWSKNPFVTLYRVMYVGGPQVKTMQNEDDDSINGIVHLSA